MKHLLVNTKVLTFLLFLFLLLHSCNNEELLELLVIEESAIIAEEEPELTAEEEPNTADLAPAIDVVDDTVFTMQHEPVDIEVHLNDINLPESIALSNTNPSNGILTINNNDTPDNIIDDTIVYTPNASFFGMDSFDYTVCDALNSENCDTATVTITIEPIENDIATELKAFPSAYGAGASATGGRGGIVVHVTNLSDSGTGSLREALMMTVPRIIVFDVSGEIHLNTYITTVGANDNYTVAGQTAPEGGITITGNSIVMGGGYTADPQQSCNNFIWRYIRFRNGSFQPSPQDTALVMNNCSNWIVDHCSFSFCDNEALSAEANAGDLVNITFQRNIVSECATGVILGNNDKATYNVGNITSLHNLWVDLHHRSPNIGGNFEQTGLQYDLINNLHFNWASLTTNIKSPGKPNVNYTGNYFQHGGTTRSYEDDNGVLKWYHAVSSADSDTKIYSANNYHSRLNQSDTGNNNNFWRHAGEPFTSLESPYFVSTPFPLLGPSYTLQTPTEAREDVLSDVGANKYLNADGTFGTYMDDFDTTKINNVKTNTSVYEDVYSPDTWGTRIISIIANMPKNTRPAGYDTDADGMPDIWETATFGDLTRDGALDHDNDGYTDLEEFLNLVDMN